MGFEVAKLRLGDAEFRVDRFIDGNIEQWAEDELLQRAQKNAWSVGLSEVVIGSMWIEVQKVGLKWLVDCIWDYRGENGEPISHFLEDGVNAHPIEAKGKAFGGADFLAWMDKNGKMVFRRKVKHPGYPGYHIMKKAATEGIPALKNRIEKETQKYIDLSRIQNG